MTSLAELIAARLDNIGDMVVNIPDPAVTSPINAPYRLLWGGTCTPAHRRLNGAAAAGDGIVSIVSVSNTATGARILATSAIDALDGQRIAGRICRIKFVADEEIEDRDNPSDYRWSLTIEAQLSQPRKGN